MNDHLQAQEFHELEMRVQKNILAKEGKGFLSSEGFIFWCNETFSDHGTSWVKPLLWYLGAGTVFFVAFNGAEFVFSGSSNIELLNKFFPLPNPSELIIFLAPLNFISVDLENDIVSLLGLILKITWWIFSLYLIYNMLLGFRKYSRKL